MTPELRVQSWNKMSIHIHDTPDVIDVCERHLRGQCPSTPSGATCPSHHYGLPYFWQVFVEHEGWRTLEAQQSVYLEQHFSQPACDTLEIKLQMVLSDGNPGFFPFVVDFDAMVGILRTPPGSSVRIPVRRLATASYGTVYLSSMKGKGEGVEEKTDGFYTQWRWYYQEAGIWKLLEEDGLTPQQFVFETKYLAGQEVFRFEVTTTTTGRTVSNTFLMQFNRKEIFHLEASQKCSVKRRPLFCSHQQVQAAESLPFPLRKSIPYCTTLPDNWYPIDTGAEYELVPLNPKALEYHLVASEFIKTVPQRRICDIYRLQNPYLWHKYQLKKQHLEQLKHPPEERQLFHGTSNDQAVQSIFRSNFDWRFAGKNASVLGKGSYFAVHASYSDRYSGQEARILRWMFLARVLTGRATKGHADYVKPPPLDPSKMYGDTYDSCVNDENKPTIYAIFDADQCYPEYVISFQ